MGEVNVVIINGYPRSGKDLLVSYLLEELGPFGQSYSTVDFIKKIAKEAGWNENKTPEARKALSDLKKLFKDWLDAPYKKTEKEIENFAHYADYWGMKREKFFFFIHSREPEEIARFVKDYNAYTIFLDREQFLDVAYSNNSDAEVEQYQYDLYIHNNGTKEQLKELVPNILREIKERGETE